MEEKKINIIEKVIPLFMKYGIKSVSMDDIANELGVSKKTLYLEFSDKSELIEAAMNHAFSENKKFFQNVVLKKINAIESFIEVTKFVRRMLESITPTAYFDLQKYYPELLCGHIEVKRQEVISRLKENILKGINEELYRNDINIDIISKLYFFNIRNIVNEFYDFDNNFSKAEIFTEFVKYHLNSIVTEKGRLILKKQNFETNDK